MAEAFLQIVLENLSSLIKEEVGLIMGVDEEMKKLSSTLTTIQAVLEDAEEKQLESKPIRDWLRKLNDLVYQIDDVLDECATHVSLIKHRNTKLSRYGLKNLLFRHKIGRRIKQVAQNLDGVAAERAKFHLREFAAIQTPRQVAATRETGSVLSEPDHIYGREDDKQKIIDILLNHVQDNKGISVLPIVGVGGLGKTTLAQLVFNDQGVVDHFEKKLWVCVSDDFDVKTLIKAMIESTTGSGSASDLQHLDALQKRIWELLNQKRYLLVLDDVWNEHQEKWFELRNILACGSTGASIIVTTRLKMVADIMGTLPTHYLKGLSEKDCWTVLRQRAFGEEKEVYPNLEAIGKEIVKKCAGVPLAAKALGGVLRFKRTEDEWIHVRESEIWSLSPEEALIVPALRLSYHHLPLPLRQCFAYWAVFPKDYQIPKEELVHLWMAHGYISSKHKLEVEDVGNEICNELLLRSLLQTSEDGDLCMHDLVHDLAESIMESKIPGKQVEENVTSIASYARIREVNLERKYVAFPKSIQLDMDMPYILRKFTRLRVLNARDISIKDLSPEIRNLKHLRRLDLSVTKIQTLPNSLCSLWNLEILNLNWCNNLVALPKNMRFLQNLRHLFLRGCDSLREMPPKIGEMRCLKTLSLFIVGVSRGNKLEELEFLNLGEEIEITHLERVENYVDAKKANLAQKKNLRDLKLLWERESASKLMEEVGEEVLEALEPHADLKHLRIEGFSGRCFPVWMTTLQKIVTIEIVDCPNSGRIPKLGELPHLELLILQNVGVEYVIMEDEVEVDTQFPSLETLVLKSLFNLRGLLKEEVMRKSGLALFPKLSRLEIESCYSSLILPPFSSLKNLTAVNCSGTTLASFSELNSLTSLSVRIDNEEMKCFAVEMLDKLTCLEQLTISSAQELPVLEQVLPGLKYLKINKCEKVTRIPEGWFRKLTALERLIIRECEELVELPEEMRYLHNLQDVFLSCLPKMVALPKALQHLSSLFHLYMEDLAQLNSLPDSLHHLTSLRNLYIYNCPQLVWLPTCIQRMTNLQTLVVRDCPKLETRCERGNGEYWHLISHIPDLRIGDVTYSKVR